MHQAEVTPTLPREERPASLLTGVFPTGRGAFWRDARLRRMLAAADILAIVVASLVVAALGSSELHEMLWVVASFPAWLVLAKLEGLYDRDHRALRHLTVDELPAILVWALTGTVAVALGLSAAGLTEFGAYHSIELWIIVGIAAFAGRSLARSFWRALTPPDRAIIVGRGPLADASRRKLELFPDIHVELVGEKASLGNGDLHGDERWLHDIDRVIVAASLDEADLPVLVALCRDRRVKLTIVPTERRLLSEAGHVSRIADLSLVEYSTWDVSRSTRALKRVLDIGLAFPLLVCLLPLLALVACAIAIDSRGPVFFGQTRGGLNGRPFRMWKFRTMVRNAEECLCDVVVLDGLAEPMFKLTSDPRVTRVGRFLRRSSIDELPQLLNVLRGDMSLVGPRPEQVELVERYEPEHLFRLDVKPGITGPMQIFGRGDLTFAERLAVEREYVENLSLGQDIRILLMTPGAVIRGRGAY